MRAPAEDIESYLAPVPEPFRGTLVAFAAFKHHCSLFVMSRTVMAAFEDELKPYDTSPGTIRFQPDHPLPEDLATRLVQARIAENEARTVARKAPQPHQPTMTSTTRGSPESRARRSAGPI